jgi:PTS system nitrogen regulatory IIA component
VLQVDFATPQRLLIEDKSARSPEELGEVTMTTLEQSIGHRIPSHGKLMIMELSDLITPDGVIACLRSKTKKQVLQELAARAAELSGINARDVFDTLLQRERLGSTGVGRGIAIPHGKISGLKNIFGLFARLEEPVDFDSMDSEPVDLVFLLLAPDTAGADHLKALAKISRLLRDASAIEKLRACADETAIYAVLTEPAASHAA